MPNAPNFIPTKNPSKPGVQRDGTEIATDFYIDTQWARFHNGMARKMGGYRRINSTFAGTSRAIWTHDVTGQTIIHAFTDRGIYQTKIDQVTGVIYPPVDRTPSGFTFDAGTGWSVDQMYDAASSGSIIMAHKNSNIGAMDSDAAGTTYYGLAGTGSQFAAVSFTNGPSPYSGGLAAVYPYTFYYGNDGFLTWSVPNTPADCTTASGGGGTNGVRVAESKIVKMMPFRGGSAGPSALAWSLNSLNRINYVGGTAIFSNAIVADWITVMSSLAIVEMDGMFFWPGTDGRFYVFNGTVQELPNKLNLRHFFDGLNYAYRSKVYGFTIPTWGEIWWCYPRGTNTECSHAIIFNKRDGSWYDTELPRANRTAAASPTGFPYPVMASNFDTLSGNPATGLWQHEYGVDEVDGTAVRAIESYFETGYFALPATAGNNSQILFDSFEPNIKGVGSMSITPFTRVTANTPRVQQDILNFDLSNVDQIPLNFEGRFVSFRIGSSEIGGTYISGDNLYHIGTGSRRDRR